MDEETADNNHAPKTLRYLYEFHLKPGHIGGFLATDFMGGEYVVRDTAPDQPFEGRGDTLETAVLAYIASRLACGPAPNPAGPCRIQVTNRTRAEQVAVDRLLNIAAVYDRTANEPQLVTEHADAKLALKIAINLWRELVDDRRGPSVP